jgi:hypothetical protein
VESAEGGNPFRTLFKYAQGGNPFKVESVEGGNHHGGKPSIMLTMKNRSKFKKCFEDEKMHFSKYKNVQGWKLFFNHKCSRRKSVVGGIRVQVK